MKIIKAIKLTEGNIQEIWECPAVYRISKLQFDPINDMGGYLEADELPHTQIWLLGFKFPCATDGGYIVMDDHGYWRYLKDDEYAKLNQADI